MKKNIFILLFFGIITVMPIMAQHAFFPYQGTITFEKTVFLKNLLKRYANYAKDETSKEAFRQMANNAPENQVLKKKLTFSKEEVLYEHQPEDYNDVVKQLMMIGIFESGISSYQNLKTNEFKSVFELGNEKISIVDTLVKTKWKITDEYRTIAGYTCRRANGVIMDSIYVVAFYTDEIPVDAGPSCFKGLPGMILGLALPELHYNMFATKVDLTPVPFIQSDFFKKKDKPMKRKEVYDKLNAIVGGYLGQRIFNLVMACYYL